MPRALDPAAYVFEGVWTNWSKRNAIQGLTLTLAPIRATLLTNMLALFFALSGGQLWTIARFTLHQLRAHSRPENPSLLHDQQQVILRNTVTDLTTTQLMWTLAWTSRRAGKQYSRAVYIGLFALLHAALFIIGGTFSNQLVNAGTAVLSRSPHCGVWNEAYYYTAIVNGPVPANKSAMTLSFEARTKVFLETQLDFEYAQKCYLNEPLQKPEPQFGSQTANLSPTCNTLKKPALNWTTAYNGTCPFAPSLCHSNSPVILLDTGDLESHEDLGINASPKDRLTYRRLTTCAVLNDTGRILGWDGFTDGEIASDPQSQQTAFAYYGPSLIRGGNHTYSYSNYAAFYSNFSATENAAYYLSPYIAYSPGGPSANASDFTAIPELEQNAADLTLFFLSYVGSYLEPIDDPWFSAHLEHHVENKKYPYINTQYARDHPIGTLGCIEQHKFCNPSKGICTPLTGFDKVLIDNAFNSSLTPHQNATFDRITWALLNARLFDVNFGLGSGSGHSLLAMESSLSTRTVLSLDLPENQWQLEVDYWHSIAMAGLQRTTAQWATGQIVADTKYLVGPQMEQDVWFCQNLMIPSTVYQSFSLVAIILIVFFGMLIIVISLTIEDWAGWIRRRSGRSSFRWQKWF